MSFYLYLFIIALTSAASYRFYKKRSQMKGAGLILVALGVYWLYLEKIPGRLMDDITGPQAVFGGWFTVICGVILIYAGFRKS